MKSIGQVLFIFCCTVVMYAQENSFRSSYNPEKANADYFNIPRESLYLHLNKTTYIHKEEIWFKGYVFDRQKKLPSTGSTNFNIQVFNQSGKELYNGLFFGSKGSFRGNIAIDSTWSTGTYYIKASTNWMNNFSEDESYTKKIKIIKEFQEKEALSEELRYDFQLLPEGGHLISRTDNSIGFKLINNKGYGVPFEDGYIIDEEGKRQMSFVSNKFGMGKFNFRPIPGKKFIAVARFANGEEVKSTFPEIKDMGISIMVTNTMKNSVMIELNTNEKTIASLTQKNHYLLIRQGHLSKKLFINFLPNETKKLLSIERDLLFKGLNSVTLFQDNHPILERLFMNSFENVKGDVMVQKGFVTKDSISLSIRMPEAEGVLYNASISILPEETKSHVPNDNICSAFMLRPYVKGFIENEKYYFTDINRKKRFDLDVLLLNQGWSKYSWNRIFDKPPKKLYSFNQGFKLKGKVQGTTKDNITKVYVHPSKYQKASLIDIDGTYSFTLANFFPEKGETILISGIEPDNSFIKPSVYVQVQLNRQTKPLNNEVIRAENAIENKEIRKNVQIPKDFITDKVQVLDEVVLKADKKEEKGTSTLPIFKHYKRNSKKVTRDMVDAFPTILDYIKSTGKFRVQDHTIFLNNSGESKIKIFDIAPVSILFPKEIPVFIDNTEVTVDLEILNVLRTSDVDRIYMDKIGFNTGARGGGGGSIRIFTRKTQIFGKEGNKSNGIQLEMKKGYEPVKEFYNPGYTNYLNPGFIDYGSIHWQPWIDFNADGNGTFKIANTGLDNVKVFIEGMGSDGSLISKIETLKLN